MTDVSEFAIAANTAPGNDPTLAARQYDSWAASNSNMPEWWGQLHGRVVICGHGPTDLFDKVGSGGALLITTLLSWPQPTGSLTCRTSQKSHLEAGEMAPAIKEMLSAGKATFSLSTTDLARLLGVERPTVYSWLRDESEPQPRNEEKIERLYALTRRWRSHTPHTLGDWARARRVSRSAVLAYLAEWMNSQSDSIAALLSTHPIRLEPALYSASQRAQELGLRSLDGGQERVDRLTGKRRAPE